MTDRSTPERFAELVTHHAVKAGYDVSGPRSGGRTKLAADTGLSLSTISRMLNGKAVPDAYSLWPLCEAIDVSFAHLFEAAGYASPGSLTGGQSLPDRPPTVKEVAARLGIRKPLNVKLLEAITRTLLDEQEAGR